MQAIEKKRYRILEERKSLVDDKSFLRYSYWKCRLFKNGLAKKYQGCLIKIATVKLKSSQLQLENLPADKKQNQEAIHSLEEALEECARQMAYLDSKFAVERELFKEAKAIAIADALEEAEPLYKREDYQKLLMELGTPVLVRLLWAQDQGKYLIKKHYFDYDCWLFRSLSCESYDENYGLQQKYDYRLEREIEEIRNMLEVPHRVGWERKVEAFLDGGANAALLYVVTSEVMLAVPGLQPIGLAVFAIQQSISWGEYLCDYKNYCKKKR